MKSAGSLAVQKTNERPGTRCVVRNVRMSAYKARQVLDLIRGETVPRAAEILQYTERSAADVIAKGLSSAVANAIHNDGQVLEELYVAACYADEGPTLKRWRPRARGRATRIRKRTCHITIIVGRQSDQALALQQAREAARSAGRQRRATSGAEARRRRVASSRAAAGTGVDDEAPPTDAEVDPIESDAVDVEAAVDTDAVDTDAVDTDVADTSDEAAAEADEQPPTDEAAADEDDD